jgi:membrane protein implicated in regulation of membrane protease activity
MLWWHWLVLGLALVALELAASGGFYVIFFGVAALLIAGLHTLDLAGPFWLQLLLFSVFSVGSLVLFRGPLLRVLGAGKGQDDMDTLVGEIGTTLEAFAPGAVGRLELRGTTWSARNAGVTAIPEGRRCVVVRRDRLMLFVQPEESK